MMEDADVLNDLDQLRSRYDVLRQLGQDGEFAIHGVRVRGTDRHYAVKLLSHSDSRSGNPGALHVWQAQTMAGLDHPNVMVLHTIHHLQGGGIALAMERRRGRTLADRMAEEGALSFTDIEAILRDIGAALVYLHGRGVVHRGIRPQSIFLDRDSGCARLAHFGLDTIDPTDPKHTQALVRAFAYLAPEQISGTERVDTRKVSSVSDLYSLGLVGYAMLAGRQPWEAPDVASLVEKRKRVRLAPLETVRADVPPYLLHAITGCIEPGRGRRWRSADEFLAHLDPTMDVVSPAKPRTTWSLSALRKSVPGVADGGRSKVAPILTTDSGGGRLTALAADRGSEHPTILATSPGRGGPTVLTADPGGRRSPISAALPGLGPPTSIAARIRLALAVPALGVIVMALVVARGADITPSMTQTPAGSSSQVPDLVTSEYIQLDEMSDVGGVRPSADGDSTGGDATVGSRDQGPPPDARGSRALVNPVPNSGPARSRPSPEREPSTFTTGRSQLADSQNQPLSGLVLLGEPIGPQPPPVISGQQYRRNN